MFPPTPYVTFNSMFYVNPSFGHHLRSSTSIQANKQYNNNFANSSSQLWWLLSRLLWCAWCLWQHPWHMRSRAGKWSAHYLHASLTFRIVLPECRRRSAAEEWAPSTARRGPPPTAGSRAIAWNPLLLHYLGLIWIPQLHSHGDVEWGSPTGLALPPTATGMFNPPHTHIYY